MLKEYNYIQWDVSEFQNENSKTRVSPLAFNRSNKRNDNIRTHIMQPFIVRFQCPSSFNSYHSWRGAQNPRNPYFSFMFKGALLVVHTYRVQLWFLISCRIWIPYVPVHSISSEIFEKKLPYRSHSIVCVPMTPSQWGAITSRDQERLHELKASIKSYARINENLFIKHWKCHCCVKLYNWCNFTLIGTHWAW